MLGHWHGGTWLWRWNHSFAYLPEDHIRLPDHKWGNPVGDWPTGTPSLPLFKINRANWNIILSNTTNNTQIIFDSAILIIYFYLALRVFSESVRMFHPFMTGMAQAATGLGT